MLLQSGKKQKLAALCATPTYSLMYLHIAVEPCYKPSKGRVRYNISGLDWCGHLYALYYFFLNCPIFLMTEVNKNAFSCFCICFSCDLRRTEFICIKVTVQFERCFRLMEHIPVVS